MTVYNKILDAQKANKKQFALLIDPDKTKNTSLGDLVNLAIESKVDFFFIGGSLIIDDNLDNCIDTIKNSCDIPVVLFPGSTLQVNKKADAILFLSLISGRNPEMLIGNHVIAAPYIKKSGIEVLPTGYILIDSGKTTSVSYISNTIPIPSEKKDIAACTAMAGEMLGLQFTFMDGGSGALNPISKEMIASVRSHTKNPLITGGGIATPEKAIENCKAGADIIVVGNAIEKDSSIIKNIADAIHSL